MKSFMRNLFALGFMTSLFGLPSCFVAANIAEKNPANNPYVIQTKEIIEKIPLKEEPNENPYVIKKQEEVQQGSNPYVIAKKTIVEPEVVSEDTKPTLKELFEPQDFPVEQPKTSENGNRIVFVTNPAICPPCKRYEPQFQQMKQILLQKGWRIGEDNTNHLQVVIQPNFQGGVIPRFERYKNGQVVDIHEGPMSMAQFKRFVEK